MKNLSKLTLSLMVIIILSGIYCISILNITKEVLEPYYIRAELQVSEDTIFEVLQKNYSDAYDTYTNMSYLIGEYESIDYIYKINFPQKMPLFAYVITKNDIATPVTYIVVFNSLGYIDNLIFIDTYNRVENSSYIGSSEFTNNMIGQRAPDVLIDDIAGVSAASDHIKQGIESVSKHYIYEVKGR